MRIPTWTDWRYCDDRVRANRVERVLNRPSDYAYNTATDSFHPVVDVGNSGPRVLGDPPREIYAPAAAVEAP